MITARLRARITRADAAAGWGTPDPRPATRPAAYAAAAAVLAALALAARAAL